MPFSAFLMPFRVCLTPFCVCLTPFSAFLTPFSAFLMPFRVCLTPLCACLTPFCACLMPFSACLTPFRACLTPFCACLMPFSACLMPFSACLMPFSACLMPFCLLFFSFGLRYRMFCGLLALHNILSVSPCHRLGWLDDTPPLRCVGVAVCCDDLAPAGDGSVAASGIGRLCHNIEARASGECQTAAIPRGAAVGFLGRSITKRQSCDYNTSILPNSFKGMPPMQTLSPQQFVKK
jgi:hypothetical protein